MLDVRVIYTIGTSVRTTEEFLSILKAFGIEILVDIRSFPTSRFNHFKKEELENLLLKEGIEYLYLGKELGGYRREGYKKHMESKEFRKGIHIVSTLANNRKVVLTCAERFPWRCHRLLVASAIEKDKKFQVVHIIDKDRTWRPVKFAKESQT